MNPLTIYTADIITQPESRTSMQQLEELEEKEEEEEKEERKGKGTRRRGVEKGKEIKIRK